MLPRGVRSFWIDPREEAGGGPVLRGSVHPGVLDRTLSFDSSMKEGGEGELERTREAGPTRPSMTRGRYTLMYRSIPATPSPDRLMSEPTLRLDQNLHTNTHLPVALPPPPSIRGIASSIVERRSLSDGINGTGRPGGPAPPGSRLAAHSRGSCIASTPSLHEPSTPDQTREATGGRGSVKSFSMQTCAIV